jgi:hypothetical protein
MVAHFTALGHVLDSRKIASVRCAPYAPPRGEASLESGRLSLFPAGVGYGRGPGLCR